MECRSHRGAMCEDHVGLQSHQLFGESPYPIDVASAPTNLHPQVAAVDPSQFREPLRESGELSLPLGITFGQAEQYADAPHTAGILRARCLRPQSSRTTDERDKFAPPHSITSSAVARSVGGTVRPSALALFKLMASSNLTGCSTGRSAGLVPCKILCTYSAARRYKSVRLGPYEMSPPATAFSFTTYIVGNRFFATKSIIHPTCER